MIWNAHVLINFSLFIMILSMLRFAFTFSAQKCISLLNQIKISLSRKKISVKEKKIDPRVCNVWRFQLTVNLTRQIQKCEVNILQSKKKDI